MTTVTTITDEEFLARAPDLSRKWGTRSSNDDEERSQSRNMHAAGQECDFVVVVTGVF